MNTATTIIDYGVISDITWPGSVSAANLIKRGKLKPAVLDEAVQELDQFYVAVSPSAPTRCIDGRINPNQNEDKLGAQVPGGAPGAALAYRLGVDKDDLTRGTFLIDAEEMIARYLRLGFAPGGHRDEKSIGKDTVGCGAIDGMDVILATMMRPDLVDDHKRVVKELMGKDFNRDIYLRNMGAAAVLNGRSKDYFRGREAIIDLLEKRVKDSIVTLKGEHQECIVAVNFVPGTTLASNRFSEAYKGIQAFGYDLWRSKQMARKIMPRPEQHDDRERFVMARVMSTVATLMALTDGTQRLVLRMPEEVA